jgi:hypothetical protein
MTIKDWIIARSILKISGAPKKKRRRPQPETVAKTLTKSAEASKQQRVRTDGEVDEEDGGEMIELDMPTLRQKMGKVSCEMQ